MKFLFTILFSLTFLGLNSMEEEEKPVVYQLPEVVIMEPTKEEEIFRTVIDAGYDSMMAKLLVAQSRHETGNYKSKLARTANNMFGMQKPKKSNTRAIGTAWAEGRPNYAKYGSIEDSTLDVLDLLKRRNCPFKFKTTYEYAKWLKSKGYYEDSLENYSRALKRQLKNITGQHLV